MLNIVSFLVDLISKHVIWLYGACGVVILFYLRAYLVAHAERRNTIFTIEKEVAAHKEGQAMSGIGAMLGIVVVITAAKYYLVPTIDLSELITPTPTLTLPMPTHTPFTITPSATATEVVELVTNTPRPTLTLEPQQTETPRPTRPAPAPACANGNVRITSPGSGAQVSGRVTIRGTANDARFQFYKVEYSQGERPSTWNVVNDIHKAAIIDGVLEELNTSELPNGVYWLQLTVVDQTGNFAPPCQVRITIQN